MLTQSSTTEVSASTVDEFCHAHRISRGTFYNLLKAGHGPSIMKVGSRTLVSAEAASAWRRRMEQSQTVAA
jgi:predicted DNA-binding transcriptional regulator AlpA